MFIVWCPYIFLALAGVVLGSSWQLSSQVAEFAKATKLWFVSDSPTLSYPDFFVRDCEVGVCVVGRYSIVTSSAPV